MRRLALQLPARVDARVREAAERLSANASGDVEILSRVETWMLAQNLTYSLTPQRAAGDPTASFLFETKEGFCEDFASAFVVLMRLTGVPARIVLGYQGGERNPLTGFWIIRQYHAHSWAEVWMDSRHGWMRVDPTQLSPATGRGRASGSSVSGSVDTVLAQSLAQRHWNRYFPAWLQNAQQSLDWRWQMLEAGWDEWVLGYDAQAQDAFLSGLGFSGNRVALLLLLCGAGLLLGGCLAAYFLLHQPRSMTPEQEHYESLCARLADRGIRRERWEGAVEFSQRAARLLPDHKDVILAWGEAYAEWHYGPKKDSSAYWEIARLLETRLKSSRLVRKHAVVP
jgi:hypothetical protein